MTAPDVVELIAVALYRSVVSFPGELHPPLSELPKRRQDKYHRHARAVLDALTESGTVQFGVRWHVGGCNGINRCTSKRHAERQAAKLIESGHEATVVSRLTLPWTAAE